MTSRTYARMSIAALSGKFDERRAASDALVDALAEHPRVVIAGGPRTGKSTVAVRAGERHGRAVKHADSLIGKLDWSEASKEVSQWVGESGEWIVEGVSAPRALRKWLDANPDKKLDATVVHFRDPVQIQSDGQRTMAKGVETVWQEILPELQRRGVTIIERD